MEEKLIEKKLLKTNLNWEKLTLYSIYSLAVLVPLVIGKPQLIVGSIVNFLILYSTLRYGIKKTLPVLILPSLTATTTGLLFDGATYFLLLLTPFIILSNYILSYFVSKKKPLMSVIGVLLKGTFLVITYKILTEVVGLPTIFITSSYLQFLTAFIGLIIAIPVYNLTKNH